MSGGEIADFAQGLSAHIRKEERQLFARLQEVMNEKELALMGQRLDQALRDAVQACVVPAKSLREK
jgi:hemerythrin-like domain-containing protein